jgi:hypothetical protein
MGLTHGIQLPNIPILRKMRAQTRFRAPRRNSAQSPQDSRKRENPQPNRSGENGRQAIQDHGRVIEHIRGESVHFAFGLQ